MTKTCPMCGAVISGTNGARLDRPRKHTVTDLYDCLGTHVLTSGEFQQRAAATLDISRATFYRLLDRGRREFLFRQRVDGRWLSISQNSSEVPDSLPYQIGEQADRALAEDP